MKNITIDNYLEFKPSEFVRSFVSDIEVAEKISEKTGKKINMDTYEAGRRCLPCIGGMACLNLTGKSFFKTESELAHRVAKLGDSIRLCRQSYINDYLRKNLSKLSNDIF